MCHGPPLPGVQTSAMSYLTGKFEGGPKVELTKMVKQDDGAVSVETVKLFAMFKEAQQGGSMPQIFGLMEPLTPNFAVFSPARARSCLSWKSTTLDFYDAVPGDVKRGIKMPPERSKLPSTDGTNGSFSVTAAWYRGFSQDAAKLAAIQIELGELTVKLSSLKSSATSPGAASAASGRPGQKKPSRTSPANKGDSAKKLTSVGKLWESTTQDYDIVWSLIVILSDNCGLLSPGVLMGKPFEHVLVTSTATIIVPPLDGTTDFLVELGALRPPGAVERSGMEMPHELLLHLGPLMHALVHGSKQDGPPRATAASAAASAKAAASSEAGGADENGEDSEGETEAVAAENDPPYIGEEDELGDLEMVKPLSALQAAFIAICLKQFKRQGVDHLGLSSLLSSLAECIRDAMSMSTLEWLAREVLDKCVMPYDPYQLGPLPTVPKKDARYSQATKELTTLATRLTELEAKLPDEREAVKSAIERMTSRFHEAKAERHAAEAKLAKTLAELHKVKTSKDHHMKLIERADAAAATAAQDAKEASESASAVDVHTASPGGSSTIGSSVSTARDLEFGEPPAKRTKLHDSNTIVQFFDELNLKKRTPAMEDYITWLEDEYEDIWSLRHLLGKGSLEKGGLLDMKGFKHAYRCKIAEALAKPIPSA